MFTYGGRGSQARPNARGVGQGVLRHFNLFLTYSRVKHNEVPGSLLLLWNVTCVAMINIALPSVYVAISQEIFKLKIVASTHHSEAQYSVETF